MEAVGADHDVEGARRRSVELNADFTGDIFDRADAVIEDGLHAVAQRLVDRRRELSARQAREPPGGEAVEDAHREPAHALPTTVDLPEFLDAVSLLQQPRQQAHASGDVEASAPEVDD